MTLCRRHLFAIAAGLVAGAAPALGAVIRKRSAMITVRAPRGATMGTLSADGRSYSCVLGRSGIVDDKHEGDGGTPAGLYPLREIRYRPDRLARPHAALAAIATGPSDGWCDDPADPAYNKSVRLPYPRSAEALWRDDGAYDALAVVGYNDDPVVAGRGSAIFLHVARQSPDGVLLPTAGCIALHKDDLLAVLTRTRPLTMIDIRAT